MSKTLGRKQWQELAGRIFVSWGAPEDIAACVARSLVDADLAGMASHGVVRIASYYGFLQAGWLNPGGRPVVVKEGPAVATVDANWGFGQPAMYAALEMGLAKSRTEGVAAVGLQHCGHIGRLGEYAEAAAAQGAVAIVMASGGNTGGLVAPYGGAERVLSTNPIAAGVPAGERPPFIMDFATSQVAAGKLELAPDKEMPIPEGWALAADGSPARTPREFLDGGALLPFGSHKGYAVAMLVELLCGGLTEAGLSERPQHIVKQGLGGNAAFAVVIDVAHFAEMGPFGEAVDAFFGRVKGVKPSLGSAGVLIPGEPEIANRKLHVETGITIAEATWARIVEIAQERGVSLEDAV
jgi:hydroxycarboxylate dehydrogenase B